MSDPGSTPDRQDLLAAELAEHYLVEDELGRGGSASGTAAGWRSRCSTRPSARPSGDRLRRVGRLDTGAARRGSSRSRPFVMTRLAEIYTLVNEPEQALNTLEPLLTIPSWISPVELRSDPTWAPLRTHHRFARLAGSA